MDAADAPTPERIQGYSRLAKNRATVVLWVGKTSNFDASCDHEPVRQTFLSASLVKSRGRQECLPHDAHRMAVHG